VDSFQKKRLKKNKKLRNREGEKWADVWIEMCLCVDWKRVRSINNEQCVLSFMGMSLLVYFALD
jgi:hypothetical protein